MSCGLFLQHWPFSSNSASLYNLELNPRYFFLFNIVTLVKRWGGFNSFWLTSSHLDTLAYFELHWVHHCSLPSPHTSATHNSCSQNRTGQHTHTHNLYIQSPTTPKNLHRSTQHCAKSVNHCDSSTSGWRLAMIVVGKMIMMMMTMQSLSAERFHTIWYRLLWLLWNNVHRS